jgi:L-lactate dehydrogenase complex protein LldG
VTARDEILGRIRTALRDVPAGEDPDDVPVARDYQHSHATGDIVELFAERAADYRATVIRTDAEHLRAQIALTLTQRGAQRVIVPDGFPPDWLPADEDGAWHGDWLRDQPPMAAADLDQVDGVITTAAVCIALTGTIVLDAGPGQGRRALSLVPDYHLCVVTADQIRPDVPDALAALDPVRPLTMISGPSATSDIELNRVEGVHGPRTLDIVIVNHVTPDSIADNKDPAEEK